MVGHLKRINLTQYGKRSTNNEKKPNQFSFLDSILPNDFLTTEIKKKKPNNNHEDSDDFNYMKQKFEKNSKTNNFIQNQWKSTVKNTSSLIIREPASSLNNNKSFNNQNEFKKPLNNDSFNKNIQSNNNNNNNNNKQLFSKSTKAEANVTSTNGLVNSTTTMSSIASINYQIPLNNNIQANYLEQKPRANEYKIAVLPTSINTDSNNVNEHSNTAEIKQNPNNDPIIDFYNRTMLHSLIGKDISQQFDERHCFTKEFLKNFKGNQQKHFYNILISNINSIKKKNEEIIEIRYHNGTSFRDIDVSEQLLKQIKTKIK